jgi:hypothetical protein
MEGRKEEKVRMKYMFKELVFLGFLILQFLGSIMKTFYSLIPRHTLYFLVCACVCVSGLGVVMFGYRASVAFKVSALVSLH